MMDLLLSGFEVERLRCFRFVARYRLQGRTCSQAEGPGLKRYICTLYAYIAYMYIRKYIYISMCTHVCTYSYIYIHRYI